MDGNLGFEEESDLEQVHKFSIKKRFSVQHSLVEQQQVGEE